MENIHNQYFKELKLYNRITVVFLLSISLYIIAGIYNDVFIKLVSVASYLTWHMIFEFASVLVSFSIFTVTYFVYKESRKLSMIFLGCTFLFMGTLDAMHTFSFKGMSDFFIANTTANRATTLWILSRSLGSLGFLVSVLIPDSKKGKINNGIFAIGTLLFSILLFVIVTYYPNVFPPMLIEDSGLTTIKIVMEYIIIIIMAITFLIVLSQYRVTSQVRDYQYLLALVFLIFSEFAFTNYGSVYDAFNYIGHIYKVVAYMILYKAIYVDNVSEPYREMKKARNELKEYSDNLNRLVKKRTRDLEEANSMLLKDIEYAKEMQIRLMPAQLPKDESVSIQAEYLPAERLSGDFYNLVRLDEDNVAIYIGDVSGHGVSAAMLTIFANQNITPIKPDENEEDRITPPSTILDDVYQSFNETNFQDETYILMLYGIYNRNTRVFRYASAGINVPPYVIRRSGDVEELDSKGFSICKLGEFVNPTYEERKVQLEKGDKLFLYSDGLVEARNSDNEIFGQRNMERYLKKNSFMKAGELKEALRKNLCNHIGNLDMLKDDVTFVILEIN
ncbi:MASE3 domain-containing protein [Gudongella sp. SC589]|jgi:sigma-B regulation protein RsbU (phosphoserine phosphatase)|uniref:MASE3 domain-containing protein n=1 Tax=Gudongella sp. SC589 TaxID=3385990 RepID=UPI003904D1A5